MRNTGLAARLDRRPASAPEAPPGAVEGEVDLPPGAVAGFLYEVVGVCTVIAVFGVVAAQLRSWGSIALLAIPVGVLWVARHVLWAGGPLRIRNGNLALLTLRGIVSVPLHDVRGVIVAPAHGLNGAPWRVVLCQDAAGRRATPARIQETEPAFVTPEDAERFAALASCYQVIVLGRGPSTQVVLAALRPALDRPEVVGNRWWAELERYSAFDVMTSRRHLR